MAAARPATSPAPAPHAPPRRRHRSRPRAARRRLARRPAHQARRPRGRRRLPQPARPRPARDRRRRAPRRRARRAADARLEPPGPHPAVAAEPVQEEAFWLAFLLVARPARRARAARGDRRLAPRLGERRGARRPRRRPAHRSPPTARGSQRAGTQAEAFLGEPAWTPERRFGRAVRAARAAGLQPRAALRAAGHARRRRGRRGRAPTALHIGKADDATTLAAKRVLVSGDVMLLERRAADLAKAAGIRLGALDRGLAAWGDGRGRRRRGAAGDPLGARPVVSVQIEELDLGARGIAEARRRAAARLLPRRGRPARRAHAARAQGVAAAPAPHARALPRRLRGRAARRRGLVEAQQRARRHPPPRRAPRPLPPRHRRRAARRARRCALPDAQRWVVATGAANAPARRLYERHGFGRSPSSSSTGRSRS